MASDDDVFSELPYDIYEKILSCLTVKERATSCLVSRNWHRMITSLDDHKFIQIHDDAYTFCNFFHHGDKVDSHAYLRPVVKLAPDNTNLTEFYLFQRKSLAFFHLSPVFYEARFLTVLHLKYCCINSNQTKGFPCLKQIYFDNVWIPQPFISDFINKCPSIVELTLIHSRPFWWSITVSPQCRQLKKIHVNLDIGYRRTVEIEIKAPNLMEFHLFTPTSSIQVDLRACTKLQIMEIDSENIPIGFPQDISSEFPRLKSLSLRLCKKMKKIKLLSPQLENLTLCDMLDLDDAIIDTPNLRSFKLMNMEKIPINWCPVVGSRLMEVEIGLKNARTTNCLLELTAFAENLGENITLSFDTTLLKEVIFHSRSNIEPLCVKHINLEVLLPLAQDYESLIDEFFSYFHPRTLLVRVDSDAPNCNFIQVLLDELKGQKTNCTNCYNYMCWRYALRSFEVLESTTTTKQGIHRVSLELHWYLPYKGPSLDCSP